MKAVIARALSVAACVVSVAVSVAGCGDSGSKDADASRDAASNGGSGDAGPTSDAGGAVPCTVDEVASGEHTFKLEHDGMERTYILHVPAKRSKPAPLVLNFHGRNSNASQQVFLSQMNETSDEEGFVVAYPEGLIDADLEGTGAKIQSWNGGTCCAEPAERDDVGFVRAVVKDIEAKFCIDPKRVYATGMSNGGFMSHKLACDAADLFAAAAPVSGQLVMPAADCKPARALPIVMFHGTADMRVPYAGTDRFIGVRESFEVWRDKNGCSGEPEVTFTKGSVSCETYKTCEDDVEVSLCTIEGMGHCWPGQTFCGAVDKSTTDISANTAMWELFERFTLP